jgi:maltose O-acetyltransferase
VIREARASDLDALVELNLHVQRLHIEAEGEPFAEPTRAGVAAWFADRLEDEGWRTLVADIDGIRAGYVLFERIDRPAGTFTSAMRMLYVHQLGVDPAHRRQGVGRALLGAVEREATAVRAGQVALDTWGFNVAAQAFFASCGYEVYDVRLRRRLHPGAGADAPAITERLPASSTSKATRWGQTMRTMKQRMLAGDLYLAADDELAGDHARAQALLERFNASFHDRSDERAALLQELLGSIGSGVVIKPPLRADYGYNIHIGSGTFVNYGCVMLDVAPIVIGAGCQLATNVQLLTAAHPIDPVARRAGWESGAPIRIGDNVWLGAGAIVCPGVTIGNDSVVGAGAVVTRDLPEGVVAVGAPARVLRTISDEDRVVLPER